MKFLVFTFSKVDADLVQSATAAMWNPYLVYAIWREEEKILSSV